MSEGSREGVGDGERARWRGADYVSDFVLGAIDGAVTTFAAISGVAGAGLPPGVALALGAANIAADGISIAVSNYQAAQSDRENIEQLRREQLRRLKEVPEEEKEEIRQYLIERGFRRELLEELLRLLTSEQQSWIDQQLRESYGFSGPLRAPLQAAWVSFIAFAVAGTVPLLPYLIIGERSLAFLWSALLVGLVFVGVGVIRGRVFGRGALKSVASTVSLGAAASAVAYVVGRLMGSFV